MGDEDPITKADFNNLMYRMDAMMVVIENHKTQFDALTSGTASTTPPDLVDTSENHKEHYKENANLRPSIFITRSS
jgi:hypothetical protein